MNSEASYDRNAIVEKNTMYFASSLKKLEQSWNKLGLSEEQFKERSSTVLKYTMENLDELVEEEENTYKRLSAKCNEHRLEIDELCKELDVESEEPNVSNCGLLKATEHLEALLAALRTEKSERITECKRLSKLQREFIRELGMPPDASVTIIGNVPLTRELSELRENVRMLREEKSRRLEKYRLAKQELTTILEITEFPPETPFERDIMGYEDTLVLSNENLQQITVVIEKFLKKKEELQRQMSKAKARLVTLWNRLNVPENERKFCAEKFNYYNQSSLFFVEEEICRCQEIIHREKRQYVAGLRAKISDLCEKCSVQKEDWMQLECELTDELVKRYEAELDRLETDYEMRKEILKMIEEGESLYHLKSQLESNATNPNRYSNRGGLLLQEEKERRKIQERLPALRNKIEEAIKNYEKRTNRTFLINGQTFAAMKKGHWKLQAKARLQRPKKQVNSPKTPALRKVPVRAATTSKINRIAFPVGRRSGGKQFSQYLRPKKREEQEGTPYLQSAATSNVLAIQQRKAIQMAEDEEEETSSHEFDVVPPYPTFSEELNQPSRKQCRSTGLLQQRHVIGSKLAKSKRKSTKGHR